MSGRSSVAGADPRRHAQREPGSGRFAPKPQEAAAAAPGRVRETPAGAAATRKHDTTGGPAQGATPAAGDVAGASRSLAARFWRDGLRAVRR